MDAAPAAPAAKAAPAAEGKADSWYLIRPLASLQLTVRLLALSMVLVFMGTLAQTDAGIWTVVSRYFRCFYVFDPGAFSIPLGGDQVLRLAFIFPGGYLIGGLMLANLVAAHALRFTYTWKRLGINLIHLGLILLLVGELVTGLFAVEQNMTIDEGQTVNWAHDVRHAELAITELSDHPDGDLVMCLDERRLRPGTKLDASLLPFTVEVKHYFQNAWIAPLRPGPNTTETTRHPEGLGPVEGVGAFYGALPLEENKGVGDSGVDYDAAYVTLSAGGEELGTWFLWVGMDDMFSRPQIVRSGGRSYELSLRFRRYYKPYSVHLEDFEHDKYTGTGIAKDFASTVRLLDPERGVDREHRIWMNHPLRYGGETFFQSAFKNDDRTTILQVVRNPGWTLPYIACLLGGLGMCFHFALTLVAFLRKRSRLAAQSEVALSESSQPGDEGGRSSIWIPLAVAGVVLPLAVSLPYARGKLETEPYDLESAARLVVSHQGRHKPLETLAKDSLFALSNKTKRPDGRPALTWLLDLMGRRADVLQEKFIRVDHPEVLSFLGREQTQSKTFFSPQDLLDQRGRIMGKAQQASAKDAAERDLFDRKLLELAQKLLLVDSLSSTSTIHPVPPLEGEGDWLTLIAALNRGQAGGPRSREAAVEFAKALRAWEQEDPETFNRSVARHAFLVQEAFPRASSKSGLEVRFSRGSPFTLGVGLYVLVFLGVFLSWLSGRESLREGAYALLLATLLIHSVGLVVRIYLMDRPPVTNLYSSAVFVGWGAVVAAAVLESLFKNGISLVTGAMTGFATLIVAHGLAADGEDTMAVLQAVLDTNFWLATHVVVITLGYSATFLAAALAAVFVVGGVLTPAFDKDAAKSTSQAIYGVVAFAMLFSYVGTILGGIWADQSWGRFWGWDPKENGALLIVLWNALILHARWGGMIRLRGLLALSILGAGVTAWSWFGTNLLGVGLHSYGFTEGGWYMFFGFLFGVVLPLTAMASLPFSRWSSGSKIDPQAAAPAEKLQPAESEPSADPGSGEGQGEATPEPETPGERA